MKTLSYLFSGTLIIPLLSGCISRPQTVAQVGPSASAPQVAALRPNGALKVFTATERHADDLTTSRFEGYTYPHSSYEIKNPDGALVKEVRNHASFLDESPDVVKLAPGKYTVLAQSTSGFVSVPVVIEDGKTTVVDLDSNYSN
jgi:hypothetical protein